MMYVIVAKRTLYWYEKLEDHCCNTILDLCNVANDLCHVLIFWTVAFSSMTILIFAPLCLCSMLVSNTWKSLNLLCCYFKYVFMVFRFSRFVNFISTFWNFKPCKNASIFDQLFAYSSFIRHFLNIYTVTATHLNCMYA